MLTRVHRRGLGTQLLVIGFSPLTRWKLRHIPGEPTDSRDLRMCDGVLVVAISSGRVQPTLLSACPMSTTALRTPDASL